MSAGYRTGWPPIPERVREAFEKLRLHRPDGHDGFRKRLRERYADEPFSEAELLKGLSDSTIKAMKRGEKPWPTTLPHPLATILFAETGIDVSKKSGAAVLFSTSGSISSLALTWKPRTARRARATGTISRT